MFKEIPLTQGKFALVDDDDFEYINQWKWYFSKTGYAHRTQHIGVVDGKIKKKVFCMHRVIMNTPNGMETDHINGDGLDNRRINLRNVNKSQNGMNKNRRRDGTSKYKGVCWQTKRAKWRADIKIGGKLKFLGYFSSEEDAAIAYNRAAIEHYKEYSRINKI